MAGLNIILANLQVSTTAESWNDAELICRKLGANLASIHNDHVRMVLIPMTI